MRCLLSVLLLLMSLVRLGWSQPTPAADSRRVSPDRIIGYTFANDAFFRTDYYFTQGMTLSVVHPALRHSPANRLLPAPAGSTRYHGLRLHYDGFTPLRIQDDFIRVGDRPYASYIYAESFQVANHAARRYRLTTALSVGFVGSAAGAKGFQTKLHEWLDAPTPRGWDFQVRNDVVLGYAAKLEKQVLAVGRGAEVVGAATASLGTLHTYAGAGARLRAGLFNSYFSSLGVASRTGRAGLRRAQLYTEGQLEGRLVGYNATLQGGLLRRDNPYTLPARAISRAVTRATGTVGFGYEGARMEICAVWVSPEFGGARAHKYAQLGLQVAF